MDRLKLCKAEAVSIIITLVFVSAVIIISLLAGDPDASVSVTFQNTISAEAVTTPTASSSNTTESPTPSSSASSSSPSPSAAKASAQSIININTATAQELCSLPGIGEVLAGRIVAYRDAHGSFKSTGAIMNVSGIGSAKYKAIKNLIAVN